MRAAVHDRYGPPEVMHIGEVDAPVPADNELLVRVVATTVNRSDGHRRAASPWLWRLFLGLRRPKRRVLGMEFAGVVESVGSAVKDFAVGDEVFGVKWFAANAELLTIRADEVLDYTKGEDFTRNRAAYDVVIDAVGRHSYRRSRRALKPTGIFVSSDGLLNILLIPATRLLNKRVVGPQSGDPAAEATLGERRVPRRHRPDV